MSQISVISKLTGVETTTDGTQVTLSHSSIVELHVERSDIAQYARSGNDLVITLNSGEVITLKNFYVTDAEGASQLVLAESDGALWWIADPTGAATYESIASTDVLLAASGSDAGGAAVWPWVLGGLAVAGGIAVAAGSGGGGGGGGDDDNNVNPGNPGNPGNPNTPDTTPPNAPTNLQFSADGTTVTGTAEPGSTITLKDANGNLVGTGKTGSDGRFTIVLGTPLTNGEQLTATATDSSGNTSQAGHVSAPDLTAPDAPDILIVNDNVGGEQGPLDNGQRTDDARPTFSGISEAGATITVYDNGIQIGTTKADANGNWSFTPSTALANGNHSITTTATDAAGNTSAPSTAATFIVDTVAPAAPVVTSLNDDVLPNTGALSNGGSTNDQRPQLSGTAEAGSVVTIYDNGIAIGTANVGSNGSWTFTPQVNLSEGNHQITVRATDVAGNLGVPSPAISISVDITAPDRPSVALNGAGTVASGTAEANSTVTITDSNGNIIGSAVVGANGSYSITLAPPQPGGAVISVIATDAAGNMSPVATASTLQVLPDTTPPNQPGNLVVSGDGKTVTGTSEPNSTVTIKDPAGNVIGTGTAGNDGKFTVGIDPAQTNGEVLQVQATDAANNTSQPGLATAPDITDPLAPTNVEVSGDGKTISGQAEAGSTVSIKDEDGNQIATGKADDQGNFSIPLNPAVVNGETLTADATDKAGNTGPTATAVAPDTTPAETPVITSVEDNVANIIGPIANGGLTNDGTPTINGTGEAGTRLYIFDGQTQIGTLVIPDSGIWSFTPSANVLAGGHVFSARAVDDAGNASGPSNSWSITVDLTPPATPVITQVVDAVEGSTGPLTSNQPTNDNRPTINGTGEPGATISIRIDGVQVGTATVGPNGDWSFRPGTAIADGSHSLTAVAIDAAGNPSSPTGGFTLNIDTAAPGQPTIGAVQDNTGDVTGPVTSGTPTDETLPVLTGTAPAGTVITVYDGNTLLGTATLNGSGGWSFTPSTPLTDGTHTLTVRATDPAGNITVSPPFSLVIDTIAPLTPDAPDVTVNPDGGTTGTTLNPGETTRDTTPTLSGEGTAGETVAIYIDGVKKAEVPVGDDGKWSWTASPPLASGTYDVTLTVTNKDGAGNESSPSQPVTIVIDTEAPDKPTTPIVSDSVDQVTGPVTNNGYTNDPRPVLTGSSDPGDVIIIYDRINGAGQVEVGRVTADINGDWSWRPGSNIVEGTHQYTTTATDEAGNVSVPSDPILINVDITAPNAPAITLAGGAATGGATSDTTPDITGTGNNGDRVIVYNNGVPIGEAVVANGTWTVTPTTALPNGPLNLTAVAVDQAGNPSAPSAGFVVTVDTVPPAVPQIDAVSSSTLSGGVLYTNDTTPTISGKTEPGSRVEVFIDETSVGFATVATDGTWTFTPTTPLDQGLTGVSVIATDAAGNATRGPTTTFTVDNVPPANPSNLDITDQGTPVTGNADAGTTVTIRDSSNNIIGTGIANSSGEFSIAVSPAQTSATTLTVTSTDPAGNNSQAVNLPVTDAPVDLPDVPVITNIDDNVGDVTGNVIGKTSDDIRPTISGTAEAGSTLILYMDGNPIPVYTVVVGAGGTWSYTPLLALGEGTHSFEATATVGGLTSGLSPAATVTIDLTAPDAPTIASVIDDVGPGTGALASGQATNDTQPTLSGRATPGDTITVYNDGVAIGTALVGPTGTWSFTPSSPLAEGSNPLTITATDPAGNESAPSGAFNVVVDISSPLPVILGAEDNVGSVTGNVATGGTTNDTTPTLTGTAEANSTVAIFDNGVQIGTVTANGTGNWTFTPVTGLAEGPHAFTVKATDTLGNVSATSGAYTVTVDTTAPTVPTLDGVEDNVTGGIVGNITTGQVTNDNTPTLSGTGALGSTIHIFNNGVEIGTAPVLAGGIWSFTPTTVLADGTYTLRVNATDAAGNVSASSSVYTFTVDTAGPAAPVLSTVIDDVGPVTGTLNSGNSTNDARPTFNGTGEIGSTIHIIVDGAEVGTALVNAQGNWTFTPTDPLGEGPHAIAFNATDAAGNTGSTSAAFNLTVDTGVPLAPTIATASDNVGTIQTPLTSGQTTDDTTPTLNGTAENNATITIYENGVVVGTTTANGSGAWSFTPPALTNGSHTWTATATDAAGNVSPASSGFTVIVDTTPPLAPVITQAIDDIGSITGPITSGQTTDDTVPRLIGTSEPNATVRIYEGQTLVGTGTADSNGNWSIDLTVTLGTGPHTFTAQATDAAGNNSQPSASFILTIDTTPPTVPVLASVVDDVGNAATPVANGGLTNDSQPTLSGTAEAGSTVRIYDGTTLIGTVTATGGNWSFTPTLGDGAHSLTVTATDAAGNTSNASAPYVINVDATAPNVPVISTVVDDVGSVTGPVTGNNPTNDTRPTLTGTAEANATVRIYDGTTLVGTVTADANGSWTLPQTSTTLSEGQHNFTATATDAAGNTSAPSSVTSITVDVTPPPAPGGLAVITNGTHVTGTAEAGSTVTITTSGGTVLGTATADGSGNFNATITPAQTGGESLVVFATDKAGNVGTNTSVTAPFTTIPNAPVIATINDNVGTVTGNLTNGKTTDDTTPTLSGTAQPNATVTLYNNGVSMGTVVADGAGNWSFTTPVMAEGSHAFTATASNGSGTSPVSSATTVIVDITAPNTPTGTFNPDGSVLTGSAEAGSTVTISTSTGTVLGTATAGSNGTYSFTFLNKQTEGQTLQVTATDAAGNSSQPGSALAPVVPLSASTNVEELDLTTTATVTNSQYSDYGFLLVGAVGNVVTLLGNDTAQVGFTVGSGGSADLVVNANATGAVLSLLNTLELVVQRWDSVNNTWTTVIDTGQPQFADLLTLGATGVSLNLNGQPEGQYRVLSYNTNLLATGSYTSIDVAVKETSAGTVTGDTSLGGNVILDVDPTTGSDNAPVGTTVSAVTNAQGVTTSVTADGTVIQGQYGTLTINLDGSYTYSLTNTSAAVIGRTESFTYTITHNGTSASANLVLSLGAGTATSGIVATDDTASLTFDTTVSAINNGTSSQGGFTVVGINLGSTLGVNLLDDLSNPIIYNVEEGTTRTMTIQASVGGVALASVFDLYIYKFNDATQTFEQMRVQPGWLRAPLLGGTSSQLTLNLPSGEYLFLLNTAAGITALTAYTLNVLQDHVYSVASVGASTTGDVLADDVAPTGTLVTEVNGVAINGSGLTTIVGEYGTLTINSSGQYTYTLKTGVGSDHISTPDTFVYTITAPGGAKDTATLNITPTARAMDAVNDVSTAMDVTSVHHTSVYSDTTVGTASWTTSLLASTQGSGNGTFVVDANTALHNASLHFNVASLLSLGGLTVNWSISDGSGVIRSGSFSGGSLLGGSIDVPLTGLDLNAGTYTLNFTGSVPGLSVGNITITPSVNGTTYSLSQFDASGTHTVNGNIFDGTDSAGAMDQLHSVDTRLSVTGYNGVTTTLDPYTGSATVNIVGHYGTLAIGADGHYTYTLNSGVSLATITSKEVFNYTLTDAAGKTDTASLTINMAPQFISSEHNDVITGTAYADTLIYQVLNNAAGNATAGNVSSTVGDHWTNFSLAQGDKIDIGDLLVGWNGSASTLGNYVSVSQSGGNTVISIDRDGTGAAYTKSALVTLDGVQTTYDELVNQQHIIT
ncbi:BapA/Bap/LapF family large adhesin [Enterobacter huaxiensis]|uniref:BapA/Bap/LapF family large adhesin n=1 Tax=Enterobacter huaxiensis TaxID=2494702 RepID=UPI002175A22D|nr:BapA/Bap/LapF family large adhesin [Enterobacter huaxiensis]MCS5452236.1 Ig-like domain-containing protein [Enterobacter huaxiensis]